MRKTILTTLFTVLFFALMQKTNAQIIVSSKLYLSQSASSYPDTKTIHLKVTAFVHTFQSGKFYLSPQRREKGKTTWSWFVPNVTHFPNTGYSATPSATYSGTGKTTQLEGTEYEYRVRITFVSASDGTKTIYTPIKSIKSGGPKPCFTMYNVQSTHNEPSKYGPQEVKTICSTAVTINGSCSTFESGYHVRVAEFDLNTWSFKKDYYDNWVGPGEAPSFISLNALAAQNGEYFKPGKLYLVRLSIGPVWKSSPLQFFRVVTCFSGKNQKEDKLDEVNETLSEEIEAHKTLNLESLKLYPNPVTNYLKIARAQPSINENLPLDIRVIDVNGAEVYKKVFTSSNFEVDVSNWEAGLYVCEIKLGDKVITKKIIKK
ncbi:T9SS type A sorting domain-containing protein [Tenacibaculum amylolyticum]|uniref:T9SS type A sorting domain-containing protein n=1 Tax=Tenacibaculum amylolyticum TaxID=104269 RepID=UPI00389667A6